MATRHLSMPADIEPLANWHRRPLLAADVSESLGGVNRSRAYWTMPKQVFESDFFVPSTETLRMRMLNDLAQRAAGGVVPVWFREPATRHHSTLRVGVGDGSRVSWPIPLFNNTGFYMRAAGVNVAGTAKAAANLLTDNQADIENDTTGLAAEGTATISQDETYQHHGRCCLKSAPTGSQSDYGVHLTASAAYMPAVAVGDVIAGLAWFLAEVALDVLVAIHWYDSTPSYLSATTGTPVALAAGQWTAATVSGTAPASTAYAMLVARRNGGPSTDAIWIDCMSEGHLAGEFSWWLPSACPSVFIADSAPANGAILTAAGSGQGFFPMQLAEDIGTSIDGMGHAELRRLRLTEWWGPIE